MAGLSRDSCKTEEPEKAPQGVGMRHAKRLKSEPQFLPLWNGHT